MKDPKPNATFDSNGQMSILRTPLLLNSRMTPPVSPLLRRDRIGSHFSDFSEVDSALPERVDERSEYSASRSEIYMDDERSKKMTFGERFEYINF